MKYKVVLIAIIESKDGKILLAKRKRPPGVNKWSLSGGVGALEDEPDPNKAVAQEVEFDFGVKFINYKLFTVTYIAKPKPTLRFYYSGELDSEPTVHGIDSIKDLKWVSLKEAINTKLAFEEFDKPVLESLH